MRQDAVMGKGREGREHTEKCGFKGKKSNNNNNNNKNLDFLAIEEREMEELSIK